MRKHFYILLATFIFGAFVLYQLVYLHYALSPNEPLKLTIVVAIVVSLIFCALLYFAYYAINWWRKKFYPDLSNYVEVGKVTGNLADAATDKLLKSGISSYIDCSTHPLPCRILVPSHLRNQAIEALKDSHA